MADTVFPREGQGFYADAIVGDAVHLRLMATHTALGPGAGVFNVKTKKWCTNREWADDIEDAKRRAEGLARSWYKYAGRKEPFPALAWKATG